MLSGCGPQNSYNPVDWWHDLEGGPIAENRPPPPGADMPYPNLASVPQKPAVPDAATRAKLSSGLIADRANAQYTASLAPLAPVTPGARNPAPRPPPVATGDDQTPNATLQGASGPPAPRAAAANSAAPATGIAPLGPPQPPLPNVPMTAPRPAPTTQVKAAPLAPPPPAPMATLAQAAGAPAAPDAATPPPPPGGVAPAAETVLPAMPDRPPAPPQLPGVPQTTAAAPPPPTPPAPPPAPNLGTGGPVAVPFAPGSSTLSLEAAAALKALAQKRGDSPVAVVGYGEAASSEAEAQVGALPLALARARAIAADLQQAGVPAAAIRINAEAMGNGGAARLLK